MRIIALCLIFPIQSRVQGQVPPLAEPPDALKAKALSAERESILREEATKLRKLAESLEKAGKDSLAREARGLIASESPKDGPRRFVPLLEIVPAGPKENEKALANRPVDRAEVEKIRASTAEALLNLARRAGKAHRLALADRALRDVLDRLPNHADARKLLGFTPLDGGWATRYAARKLKDGWTLHPTYGWVEASWVPHLERGELPGIGGNGKNVPWLPAADADALRRDFSRPWTISTEHFQIRTNAPLAEGIAFARRVEDFHQLFFSLFADLVGPSHPLALRLEGKEPKTNANRPHSVNYFASHAEFVNYLKSIDIDPKDSLGYYIPPFGSNKRNPSYFYKDEKGEISPFETLYHETSHQLLLENAGPALFARNLGNYWVFEGLGTYFETIRPQPDGALLVGGRIGRRFEVARQRIIQRKEYTPLAPFVAMGARAFINPPTGDVYLDYGEAMALAVFLLESDRGRYRDEFLDYVRDVYKGRYRAHSGAPLDERLNTTFDTLDLEFLGFLNGDER